jgi:hypothetical protein
MLDSLGTGQRCPGLKERVAGGKEVLHIPILVPFTAEASASELSESI